MRHARRVAISIAWAAVVHGYASALTLSPTFVVIHPDERSEAEITLTGSPGQTSAIEISVARHGEEASGRDGTSPVDDLFEVAPALVLLDRGESQSVHIQWTGEPQIGISQSFLLVIEELTVERLNPADGDRIDLRVTYSAPLHISPPRASARPSLSSHVEGDAVVISNFGNTFGRLLDHSLIFTSRDSGAATTIAGAMIAQALQTDSILPGTTKRLALSELGLQPDAVADARIVSNGPQP